MKGGFRGKSKCIEREGNDDRNVRRERRRSVEGEREGWMDGETDCWDEVCEL